MITQENIQFVISIATLGAMIFGIYKIFSDPDVKASEDIAVIQEGCKLKHKSIDDTLLLIKENHLKHIEDDIKELGKTQVQILTILKERNPNK